MSDELTREQIEFHRSRLVAGQPIGHNDANILCDMALRTVEPPPRQDQEELRRRVQVLLDMLAGTIDSDIRDAMTDVRAALTAASRSLAPEPDVINVSPEEFERIVSDMINPDPPTEAIMRGAELLRKLYPLAAASGVQTKHTA